ncbi:MAG: histidine phosphatase family protein [Blautia sp.]|nr:histidine phosphatase family protein [Lachnoclostridium sp.]MCM1212120.1 histidine phosphatase family protein [Blautia sp.]
MTNVYFVRHATPNFGNHDDLTRELTTQGLEDRKLVTSFLWDKKIDIIFSSPYKRAIDTIKEFADSQGMEITLVDDFRERKIENTWIDDFNSFCKKQWEDFDFKLSNGESLREVQARNINALHQILETHMDKNIVIGSHGTALSTIIHYFDSSFGYNEFNQIKNLMPWIVKFSFEKDRCLEIAKYNLF